MNWITGFTIIILVFGLMFGLVVSGINPWKNPAEAERIKAETAHLSVVHGLDEQLQQAKTEAEIASIQRQQEAEQKRFEAEQLYIEQLYAKKLTAYDGLMRVRDTFLLALGLSMSGSLFLFVGGKVLVMYRTIPVQNQKFPRNAVIKQDWQRQIEMARTNERLFRSTAVMEARLKAVSNPASITKQQRDNLPLAI